VEIVLGEAKMRENETVVKIGYILFVVFFCVDIPNEGR